MNEVLNMSRKSKKAAMDDIGEIMESDKELEDAYIAARKNTEEVKAEYETFLDEDGSSLFPNGRDYDAEDEDGP